MTWLATSTPKRREQRARDGAGRDARGRFARAGALEDVAQIVAAVLQPAGQVGVAGPRTRDGGAAGAAAPTRAGSASTLIVCCQFVPVAVANRAARSGCRACGRAGRRTGSPRDPARSPCAGRGRSRVAGAPRSGLSSVGAERRDRPARLRRSRRARAVRFAGCQKSKHRAGHSIELSAMSPARSPANATFRRDRILHCEARCRFGWWASARPIASPGSRTTSRQRQRPAPLVSGCAASRATPWWPRSKRQCRRACEIARVRLRSRDEAAAAVAGVAGAEPSRRDLVRPRTRPHAGRRSSGCERCQREALAAICSSSRSTCGRSSGAGRRAGGITDLSWIRSASDRAAAYRAAGDAERGRRAPGRRRRCTSRPARAVASATAQRRRQSRSSGERTMRVVTGCRPCCSSCRRPTTNWRRSREGAWVRRQTGRRPCRASSRRTGHRSSPPTAGRAATSPRPTSRRRSAAPEVSTRVTGGLVMVSAPVRYGRVLDRPRAGARALGGQRGARRGRHDAGGARRPRRSGAGSMRWRSARDAHARAAGDSRPEPGHRRGCARRSAAPPARRSPCSSKGRAARARSWSRARCTG